MSKKDDKQFFDDAEKNADKAAEVEAEQNDAPWWNFEGKGGEEAFPNFKGRFEFAQLHEKQGTTGMYDCLMVYARDLDDVLYKMWLSAGGAVRGVKDAAPAVGSLLLIRFEGVQESKTSDRKFKAYSVVSDQQDEALWDSYRKAFESRSVAVAKGTRVTELAPDEAPF
jgi:hypothetical protein